MEKFMQHDALVFARVILKIGVENDNTIPNKSGGMRRMARRIAKIRAIADFHRAAVKQRSDFDSLVSH